MKITQVWEENEGDWEGIYIDGKLFDQNHSINFELLMEELAERGIIEYERIDATEYMKEKSKFPKKLEKLIRKNK